MWENIEEIKEIIKNSINKTDTLNKLGLKNHGGNFNTLSFFIRRNNIDTSHFIVNKSTKEYKASRELNTSDILIENSLYVNTSSLKKRLYKEEIKKRYCEICGQGEEWRNRKMSLILDHINGDRHDNRIENLRIVCPNCNATLETHCRGLNAFKDKYTKYDECFCGNTKQKKSEMCINCYKDKLFKIRENEIQEKTTRKETRKVQRPPYEQLLLEVNEIGYVATGKKYGVSDNSIRKWIRMYKKYGENF